MTAKEALETSKANFMPEADRLIDWCLERISEAAKKGEFECRIDGFWLSYGAYNEAVISRLQEIGYNVDETWWARSLIVKWGEK